MDSCMPLSTSMDRSVHAPVNNHEPVVKHEPVFFYSERPFWTPLAPPRPCDSPLPLGAPWRGTRKHQQNSWSTFDSLATHVYTCTWLGNKQRGSTIWNPIQFVTQQFTNSTDPTLAPRALLKHDVQTQTFLNWIGHIPSFVSGSQKHGYCFAKQKQSQKCWLEGTAIISQKQIDWFSIISLHESAWHVQWADEFVSRAGTRLRRTNIRGSRVDSLLASFRIVNLGPNLLQKGKTRCLKHPKSKGTRRSSIL